MLTSAAAHEWITMTDNITITKSLNMEYTFHIFVDGFNVTFNNHVAMVTVIIPTSFITMLAQLAQLLLKVVFSVTTLSKVGCTSHEFCRVVLLML